MLFVIGKVKIKVTLEQATKAQRGSRGRYSSTFSLTSALDGVGGQRHAPGRFNPGKKTSTHCIGGGGWAPGPVWSVTENLSTTGIRSPDSAARSDSLYRLSYLGPRCCV